MKEYSILEPGKRALAAGFRALFFLNYRALSEEITVITVMMEALARGI